MKLTRIGLDLAKNVFQIHGADRKDKIVLRKQIKRAQMHTWFKILPACTIGIEACGTSHHWARKLGAMGHTVKLIPAQHVKPCLKHNKNDANDAVGGGVHAISGLLTLLSKQPQLSRTDAILFQPLTDTHNHPSVCL